MLYNNPIPSLLEIQCPLSDKTVTHRSWVTISLNSIATLRVYLYSFSRYWLPKLQTHAKFRQNLTLQQFKVIQGHRSWCQSKAHVWLIVTLAVLPTVFEILTLKSRKWLIFPTPPLFDAPLGDALEFLEEIYLAKTRGIGLTCGKNFIILTSTVFDWTTRVTDRETDRQTDRR